MVLVTAALAMAMAMVKAALAREAQCVPRGSSAGGVLMAASNWGLAKGWPWAWARNEALVLNRVRSAGAMGLPLV